MIDQKKIEQITRQIHEYIPKGISNFSNDIEKKICQILQTQLIHLNLISREEFDVQSKVLLRIREQLDFLEQRLAKLEKNCDSIAEIKSELKTSTIDDKL